ncbi:hypothetical protein Tco_0734044 [Tanacetum coccineum]
MTTTAAQQVALDNALICPRLPNQEFDELPSNEEIVSFIKELRHKGEIKYVSDVVVDQILHIPNREQRHQEPREIYYPRFTKAIIRYFITKDKSISMRNRMFTHTVEDGSILGLMRFVSKVDDYQVYGALLPEVMTNHKMRDSPAYKTYLAFATGAASPKKSRTCFSFKEEYTCYRRRRRPRLAKKVKKTPAKAGRSKRIDLLSDAALLEEAQVKKDPRRSCRETTIHQAGGSGDEASFQPEVPDEPKGKLVDDGPEQSWLNDMAKAKKPPLTFDELMHTPIDFYAFVMNRLKIDNLTKEILVGPAYNLLKGTCKSYVELDYTMEECYRDLSEQLDWNNPDSHRCPYDLTKPLPVQMTSQGRQIVSVDFFFNNDLEYLRGGSNDKKYTASTTKSKAARYELKDIEDMILTYGFRVVSVKVNDWYGYGHLEEIIVKRAYQQLYTFKEGDFKRLHLNDIEDMLLLIVQNKLNNLDGNVLVHLEASLRIPAYTTLSNPQGVIYEDKLKQKRFMCVDEIYKFSDSTLISVRDTLSQMLYELHLGYNKAMRRRQWTRLDQQMSRIMIKAINQNLLDRRIFRSLEKFVGGREYGEDLRLLQRTI